MLECKLHKELCCCSTIYPKCTEEYMEFSVIVQQCVQKNAYNLLWSIHISWINEQKEHNTLYFYHQRASVFFVPSLPVGFIILLYIKKIMNLRGIKFNSLYLSYIFPMYFIISLFYFLIWLLCCELWIRIQFYFYFYKFSSQFVRNLVLL